MTNQDNLMKETFTEPPLIAFKQQGNIGDSLIRAKISPNILHQKRQLRGMKTATSNAMQAHTYRKENLSSKVSTPGQSMTM
jgi:hypothetical protein